MISVNNVFFYEEYDFKMLQKVQGTLPDQRFEGKVLF